MLSVSLNITFHSFSVITLSKWRRVVILILLSTVLESDLILFITPTCLNILSWSNTSIIWNTCLKYLSLLIGEREVSVVLHLPLKTFSRLEFVRTEHLPASAEWKIILSVSKNSEFWFIYP